MPYSQVISVFRQLEMEWPVELMELFDFLSVFNLNIEILSVDCFVEWTWTRKFMLGKLWFRFGYRPRVCLFIWREYKTHQDTQMYVFITTKQKMAWMMIIQCMYTTPKP